MEISNCCIALAFSIKSNNVTTHIVYKITSWINRNQFLNIRMQAHIAAKDVPGRWKTDEWADYQRLNNKADGVYPFATNGV